MPKSLKIPTVRFNLKSHDAEKDKNIPVLALMFFRYKGNRLTYSTGHKVKPVHWDGNRMRAKNLRGNDYSDVNSDLNRLEEETKAIFKEHDYGKITVVEFKKELAYRTGKAERSQNVKNTPTFFEFLERFLSERKNRPNFQRGTWKVLNTVANLLKDYSKETGSDLDFDDIDWDFRERFESWLYSHPRNHSINYAAKVFQVVSQFLNEARRRRYTDNDINKHRLWNIQKVKIKRVTLTFEELEALANFDLSNNKRLDRVRDLFLIGCYTGLRFSDFTRISPDKMIEEEGVEMIEIITQKTFQSVFVPVSDVLKKILVKYNYKVPGKISNQKMNKYLKELCKLSGLNTPVTIQDTRGGKKGKITKEKWELVTSHTARRSFATNYLKTGIFEIDELMQITGHSTEKQFREYIQYDGKRNAISVAKKMAQRVKELQA